MNACEHGSLKRQCPWCENQELEQSLSELQDEMNKEIDRHTATYEKLAKAEAALKVYEEAVELVTDRKSSSFPNGEMLKMHGSKSGGYFCVYDRETIVKVRQAQQKVKEILGSEG